MQQKRPITTAGFTILSSCIAIAVSLFMYTESHCWAQDTVTTGAWLTFRADPAHTGTINLEGPPEDIELKGRWRISGDNSPVSASPAVTQDGIVYIGTEGGYVAAIQPAGGMGWVYKVEGSVLSSPSVDETGNVFVVTDDGYMYYISSTGELIWKSDFNIGISTSPVLSGGTAYIGTDDFSLLGINLNPDLSNSSTDTRKLLPDAVETFNFLANGRVKSSPAFSGNTVFFGGGEYVYALNPNAGGGGGTSTTSIGGGSSATTTVPNPIKWRYSINSDVYSSPAVKGNKVYVGADDGYLYALSENVSGSTLQSNSTNIINEGKLVWKRKTGDKIRSSPAVATPATTTAPVTQFAQQQTTALDRVYVGSDDGNLYAYDANGEFKWKFPTAGPVRSSPAVDKNGDIYFGSDDGSVYALFPSGALKWRYQTYGAVRSSPAIGPEKRLYVGSDDGYLYCLGQSNKDNSKPDFSIAIANSLTFIENDGNPAIITATITSQSQDPNYLSRIAVVTMDLTPLNLLRTDPENPEGELIPVTKVIMLDNGQGQDLVARDGIFTYAFGMTTKLENLALADSQGGIYTFFSPVAPPVGPVPIMITVEDIYAAQDILNHEISRPFPLSVSQKLTGELIPDSTLNSLINNRLSNQTLNLSITAGTAIIISITPNQGAPGDRVQTAIEGLNTTFTTNNTKVEIFDNTRPPNNLAYAYPSASGGDVVVLSETSLTAILNITNRTDIAVTGTWDVIVTTQLAEIVPGIDCDYVRCIPCFDDPNGLECNSPIDDSTYTLKNVCDNCEFAIKTNGFTISNNPTQVTTSIPTTPVPPVLTGLMQNMSISTPRDISTFQAEQGECVIQLDAANPSGIPAYNSPWQFNSGYERQITIENADSGDWNLQLQVLACTSAQKFKITAQGSNVGYLTGQVRNGSTGQGVDGAQITALIGEGPDAAGNSVESSGGGYYMLPIAAINDRYTVIASKDALIDTRNDIVIIKDEETPLDFSLKLDTTCPVTSLVKDGNLKIFYAVRDGLLAKSNQGRRWVDLYYRHAQEVTDILVHAPALRKKAQAFIVKAAQESGKIMKGENTESRLKTMLAELIDSLIQKGSTGLKKALRAEKENILNYIKTR